MKTLHISIITVVGIVVIAMTTIGIFFEKLGENQQQPYTGIGINGVKENYTLNEPIAFAIVIEGYGSGCGDTKAIITKENDSQYKSLEWHSTAQCHSGANPNNFNFSALSGNTSINQPGNYIITVSFDDLITYHHNMAEKKFSVIPPQIPLQNTTSIQNVFANSTNHIIYHRFYSASTPQLEYVLKQGQSMTIPINVYYSERNAVRLITFTHIQYCGPVEVQLPPTPTNPGYQVPKECNLDPGDDLPNPPDISAVIDKKSIDLPAISTNETTVRDTANLIVSSSQDARTGVYRITIGLTDDNEFHGGRMVYFKVD